MKPTAPLRRPSGVPPGAHIAVLAISGPADRRRIETAATRFRNGGFQVTVAANAFDHGARDYLAGDDRTRLDVINQALRDDRYDAFFFTRGGYGAMRILDGIDYEAIANNPRPIVGYSDLTALHQSVARRAGVTTFHGPMLNLDFHDGLDPSREAWMWNALRGESNLEHTLNESQVVVQGCNEGILFGGCLAITTALVDTPYDYWVRDGIWFWEDVAEPLYKIDRMLTHLRLSGRFRALRGIVVGQLRECGDGQPNELVSLLREFFGELGIPVVRSLPFGHYGNNLMLPIGQRAVLDTGRLTFALPDPVVQDGKA